MPLIEAGFRTDDGRPDNSKLIVFGPTLLVTVRHLAVDGKPSEPNEAVHALIDTGASESCIDVDLAKKLDLPVIDTQMISGVSGAVKHPVFLARIDIPQLSGYQYGRFAGAKLVDGGQQHSVLLGRTFLQRTIMIYDGMRAQVTLASPQP